MAVQNNATVQMVRGLISGDINLPLYAAKGGKLVPVYYDGTSWTAISGYTAQVNVGDVALVLMLASSANWGTNQLGDLRVITAVSTSLTLSETLLGNIFGAGGRYRVGDIVISENETSPAEAYGGSWEKITDRFLVGAGGSYALGSMGGSTEHSHSAGGLVASIEIGGTGFYIVGVPNPNNIYTYKVNIPNASGEDGSFPETNGAQVNGNTETANNTPPYIAVNIWRRVA